MANIRYFLSKKAEASSKKKKKKSVLNANTLIPIGAGLIGGYGAGKGVKKVYNKLGDKIEIVDPKKNLSPKLGRRLVEQANLPQLEVYSGGHKVYSKNPRTPKQVLGPLATPSGEKIIKKEMKEVIKSLKDVNNNAFWDPFFRRVYIPPNVRPEILAHELGHGVTYSGSALGKINQLIGSPLSRAGLVASPFLGATPDENVSTYGPAIAAAASIPQLADEGLASWRAPSMMRGAGMNEQAIKLAKKRLGKAWLSYTGYPLAALASGYGAKYISDYIRGKQHGRST